MKVPFQVLAGSTAFVFLSLMMPLANVSADQEADRAKFKRQVDQQISALEEKINETREDYKEDGVKVDQKIQEYQDRISEVKRESKDQMDRQDRNASHVDQADNDMGDRISNIRRDFSEWRLKRAINSYDDKIDDLRVKAQFEENPGKKLELEEKIQKLDAKYNTTKAKLNDLRATDGENWDKLEQELDASLEEINRDFDEVERAQ